MKRITSFVVQSLVTILIGSGAFAIDLQAQTDLPMTVSIPFPFTMDSHSIAAGTYQFSLVSGQFLLSVLNVKTGEDALFVVRPERGHVREPQGFLIFSKSEGSSVLSEVHFRDTNTFSEVIRRRGARRMAAKESSTRDPMTVAQR